jgi:polyhydroxybutyrate depolymerase
MKKIFTIAAFFLFSLQGFSQFSNESFFHKGLNRLYRIYVPPAYDGSKAVPMMLCLHGLGDNMTNFSAIGMNFLADTANFIVIFPQAVLDPVINATSWNSGAGYNGYFPNSSIDDVGFLLSLIDTLSVHYSINQQRIYACGFSMGGFMSNRLACEANDRIAAIASVAGTIGTGFNCVPGKAISVCHFHGTADPTVSYTGGAYGMGAQALVNFWVNNDNCNSSPLHTALPNTANDGFTVDHYEYSGGDSGTEVELFKVNNANHTWLTPLNDISYSIEIWKFFNKHLLTSAVKEISNNTGSRLFEINPNPGNGIFNIRTKKNDLISKIQVFNSGGDTIFTAQLNSDTYRLDMSGYPEGAYFVRLQQSDRSSTEKIILRK